MIDIFFLEGISKKLFLNSDLLKFCIDNNVKNEEIFWSLSNSLGDRIFLVDISQDYEKYLKTRKPKDTYTTIKEKIKCFLCIDKYTPLITRKDGSTINIVNQFHMEGWGIFTKIKNKQQENDKLKFLNKQ